MTKILVSLALLLSVTAHASNCVVSPESLSDLKAGIEASSMNNFLLRSDLRVQTAEGHKDDLDSLHQLTKDGVINYVGNNVVSRIYSFQDQDLKNLDAIEALLEQCSQ